MKWKTITLIGLTVWAYVSIQDNLRQKSGSKYAPTVGQLSDAYRTNNEKYFYGGLSNKFVIQLQGDIENDAMADIHSANGQWIIRIDPSANPTEKQAEMSLIHEQCHEEDFIRGADEGLDQHSRAHEACMERVASQRGFFGLW